MQSSHSTPLAQASITVLFSEDWADTFQRAAMNLFSRHDGSSQMICHDRYGNRLRVLQVAGPRFELDNVPFPDKFPLHLRLEQAERAPTETFRAYADPNRKGYNFELLLIHPVIQMYNTVCLLFAVLVIVVWCITAMEWCVTEYLHSWVTKRNDQPFAVLGLCYIFLIEIRYLRYTCELFCVTALDVFWHSLGALPFSHFFLELHALFMGIQERHKDGWCGKILRYRPTVAAQYVFYFFVDVFPLARGVYTWNLYTAIDLSIAASIFFIGIYMMVCQAKFVLSILRRNIIVPEVDVEDVVHLAIDGSQKEKASTDDQHCLLDRAAALMRLNAQNKVNKVGRHWADNKALLRRVDIFLKKPEGEGAAATCEGIPLQREMSADAGTGSDPTVRIQHALKDKNEVVSVIACLNRWLPRSARSTCSRQETYTFDGEMGIVCSGCGIVQGLADGSEADKKGIKAGDMITSVDGDDTFSNANAVLQEKAHSRRPYDVTVQRPYIHPYCRRCIWVVCVIIVVVLWMCDLLGSLRVFIFISVYLAWESCKYHVADSNGCFCWAKKDTPSTADGAQATRRRSDSSGHVTQATHTFEPGSMGLVYDANGTVNEVFRDGQAFAKGVVKGDQILKVGAEDFSPNVLHSAETNGQQYEVTFKELPTASFTWEQLWEHAVLRVFPAIPMRTLHMVMFTSFVNILMLVTLLSIFQNVNWYIAMIAFLSFPLLRCCILYVTVLIYKLCKREAIQCRLNNNQDVRSFRSIWDKIKAIPPDYFSSLRALNFIVDFGIACCTFPLLNYSGRLIIFCIASLANKSHVHSKIRSTIKSAFVVMFLFLISIAFIAAKSNNPGKEEDTTCWTSKAGDECTWIKPSTRMGYPFCGSKLWDTQLDILDFALFSHLAYKHSSTINLTLPHWFPGWHLHCQRVAWTQPPNTKQCDFSTDEEGIARIDWTTFMEFRYQDSDMSVIAVRGTASPLEALLDLNVWLPAAVLQGGRTDLLASTNLKWIHWFVRHNNIYNVGPLQNFQVLHDFVTEAVKDGRNVILTGHSLGGGLAQLIAKQFDSGVKYLPKVVTFASPNSMETNAILGEPGNAPIRGRAVGVAPQFDFISGVDTKEGVVFPIACYPKTEARGPLICHMIWETICELLAQCGDSDRSKAIRFHPLNPMDKCDMYEREGP